MSLINSRRRRSHLYKLKRLHHTHRHNEKMMITNFTFNIIHRTSKYIKFFDYPLSELLTDHSTDPLQSTTRQYVDTPSEIPSEGRFANHEMIIRRNGETTILRPKQDLALANGFAPVHRPSSILPSYQSIMFHSQIAPLSIMNKMPEKKSEQTSTIKTTRKSRYQRRGLSKNFMEQNNLQNYSFAHDFHYHNRQESNFIHLVKQALSDIMEEKKHFTPQPAPLMSILPAFHIPSPNYNNRPFTQRLDEICLNLNMIPSPNVTEQQFTSSLNVVSNQKYEELFHSFSSKQNNQSSFIVLPPRPVCPSLSMPHHRNCTHMSGYFSN